MEKIIFSTIIHSSTFKDIKSGRISPKDLPSGFGKGLFLELVHVLEVEKICIKGEEKIRVRPNPFINLFITIGWKWFSGGVADWLILKPGKKYRISISKRCWTNWLGRHVVRMELK